MEEGAKGRSVSSFVYLEGDRVFIKRSKYGGRFGTIARNRADEHELALLETEEVLVDGETVARRLLATDLRAVYEYDEKVYASTFSPSFTASLVRPCNGSGKKRKRDALRNDDTRREEAEAINLARDDYEDMVYRIQRDAWILDKIKTMWPPDYLIRARQKCGFPAELEPLPENGLWAQIKKMFSSA